MPASSTFDDEDRIHISSRLTALIALCARSASYTSRQAHGKTLLGKQTKKCHKLFRFKYGHDLQATRQESKKFSSRTRRQCRKSFLSVKNKKNLSSRTQESGVHSYLQGTGLQSILDDISASEKSSS